MRQGFALITHRDVVRLSKDPWTDCPTGIVGVGRSPNKVSSTEHSMRQTTEISPESTGGRRAPRGGGNWTDV
jgi:hypothetical protein